jgi:hypothetical protein
MTKSLRALALTMPLLCGLSANASALPITPITYTFTGTLTSVSSTMDFLMPGLTGGTAFWGTMGLSPYAGNDAMTSADLRIVAGDQIVVARSIGLNPLADFSNFTALGGFSSPTLQNGYVNNVFFQLANGGTSLGSLAFFVMGTDTSNGTTAAGNAWGDISSVTTVPEPASAALTVLGLGIFALRHARRTRSR